MRQRRRFLLSPLALVLAFPFTAAAAAGPSSAHPAFHPPAHYYLALGDSLAFGWHDFLCDTSVDRTGCYASLFEDGYTNDFAALMRQVKPELSMVNYSCPGESSSSMLGLGTPGYPSNLTNCLARYVGQPLHDSYPLAQSQMAAALDFLAAHSRATSPITLDIGANDLIDGVWPCVTIGGSAPTIDTTCFSTYEAAILPVYKSNLDTILTDLHNAAPTAEIILMNVPDVFEFWVPGTVPTFQNFNDGMNDVVSQHRNVRMVDAFQFMLSMLAGPQPTGLYEFCSLDAFCSTNPPDIHPTAAGYAAMAQMFWQISDYARMVS